MKSILRAGILTMAVLGIAPSVYAQAQPQGSEHPCMADAARLCSGIEPGQQQMACLKQHARELSPACKKKMVQMKEQQELNKQQQQPQPPPPPQP